MRIWENAIKLKTQHAIANVEGRAADAELGLTDAMWAEDAVPACPCQSTGAIEKMRSIGDNFPELP